MARIIVIADGVSTCKNSKRGAELACKAIKDIMLKETEYIFASDCKKIAGLLLSFVLRTLRLEAKTTGEAIESYSSTLSFVCLNKAGGEIMTFMLGDSLIYSVRDAQLSLACKPHFSDNSGTCTTTTKNVETAIDINIIPAKNFSQFVLATDGAWKTFYKNGVLSAALKNAVANGNISSYLEEQKCDDDCSIAVMNLKKGA